MERYVLGAQRRGVDEPWREAGFLDEVADLQRQQLQEPAMPTSTPLVLRRLTRYSTRRGICTYENDGTG